MTVQSCDNRSMLAMPARRTMAAEAVLFDLDGTLIDTTALILHSCAHTFEEHFGVCPSEDELIATFGRSLPEALYEFAVAAGRPDPARVADEMLETYRAHNDVHHDALIRGFDGVADMLATLRTRGLRLGLVTSKREGTARRGIDRYGLAPFFDAAIFHDDTERHKPDPEPLLAGAARLHVAPSDAVYVGDSIHDIAAGRAARIRTIAAGWGPFRHSDLHAAGPDALVAAPADVARLVTRRRSLA
jgi:pyrophosphatase PpaX